MSKPDQIYTSYIKTTPEKLWDALINPEFTKQYWFGSGNVAKVWKKGAEWEHVAMESGKVHHSGEILECDPPKRLVLSWSNPGDKVDVSRVTFDIKKLSDEAVQLTIIHGGFVDNSAMADRVSGGWPKVVANLKVFLEEGCATHDKGCAA